MSRQEISAPAVIDLYNAWNDLGITTWIDGGWGVDALLGNQSRPHRDLDIAVNYSDVPRLRQMMMARGYREIQHDDTSEWNFVLRNDLGHTVDVHAFVNGADGKVEKGIMYPAGSLTGTGKINDTVVRCIEAKHMIKFHTGYSLRETDYKDVLALCERFGIDVPPEYQDTKRTSE